jgi:hypothetical protein
VRAQRSRATSREVDRRSLALATAGLAGSALLLFGVGIAVAEEASTDSCVACHSNPDFLVTNKKLHDYFERWKDSTHAQEGISCADCHGGDPEDSDKKASHRDEVGGQQAAGNAVNFGNIPNTCGACHEGILEGFRESAHFDHLVREKQDKQGPNCVTCHGSLNVEVLNVNAVEAACSHCHNDEQENHPDVPKRAENILNRFLSIQRYYRFIGKRGDPIETQLFFKQIDSQVEELSVLWHTFDLPEIETKTDELLQRLKAKRTELREREKKARADR